MVSCRCRVECWGGQWRSRWRSRSERWLAGECWWWIDRRDPAEWWQNVSSHARHSLVIDLRQEWRWSSCYIQHSMQRTSLIRTQSYCSRTLIMRHSVSIMVAPAHNKIYHTTFVPSLIFASTNWYYLIVHARIQLTSWLPMSTNC